MVGSNDDAAAAQAAAAEKLAAESLAAEKGKIDVTYPPVGIFLVILVIFDEVAGALLSRVPMYYELKLAFLVYLWYPKTRGTDIVYETFVRPLVMQYEPNIEERLRHLRANAGDLIVFYLKNFTDRGYELFLRALDYARSQASRGSRTRSFFSFRGDRAAERPSFVDDDFIAGVDRRTTARQRRPRGNY